MSTSDGNPNLLEETIEELGDKIADQMTVQDLVESEKTLERPSIGNEHLTDQDTSKMDKNVESPNKLQVLPEVLSTSSEFPKEVATTINVTTQESKTPSENFPKRSAVVNPKDNLFEVKKITFGGIPIRIVLQNVNGACPLLAVVNALALKGQLEVRDLAKVSQAELTEQIADCLFRLQPADSDEQNYAKGIDDVIALLPSLGEGLVINLRFQNVQDFEFTPALSLFDMLGVRLVHGWLPDPQLRELCRALGSMNYIQAALASLEANSDNSSLFIGEFLNDTSSQLTYYGIEQLNTTLKDGEVAVLFRNNHFATIYKRRDEIFLLCTDSGFATSPNVVWETLCVDGDSYFVDGQFRTSRSAPADHELADGGSQVQASEDYKLAVQLQNEEILERKAEEQAAKAAQQRQQSSSQESPTYLHRQDTNRQKSKSSCSVM